MESWTCYQVGMQPDETFGERLRRARRTEGMTLRQLAELVDVDFTYLSKLENDRLSPPSDATIVRLSEALSLDPDELFAAARKVPTDLRRHVKEGTPQTALLLRRLSGRHLTEDQYRRIMEILGDQGSNTADQADHDGT